MKLSGSVAALVRLFAFVLRRYAGTVLAAAAVSVAYSAAKPAFMVLIAQGVGPLFGLSDSAVVARALAALNLDLSVLPLATVLSLAATLGLLLVGLDAARSLLAGRAVWGPIRDLRQSLCERLLSHPVGFFSARRTGELLSRINNDVEGARVAANFLSNVALYHPFQIAIGLGLCLWMDWRLTLLAGLAAPVVAVGLHTLGRRILLSSRKGLERMADMTDVLQQLFSGIRVVKGFGGEPRERERFIEVNRSHYRQMTRIVQARAASSAVVNFCSYVGAPVLVALVATLGKRGWIDLSGTDLAAYVGILVGQVVSSLRSFTKAVNDLQTAAPGAARTFALLDEPVGLADAGDAAPLDAVRGEIAFEEVHFDYGNGPVLSGVTFRARPGECVAIVGPSGAGKSTLLDLALRFHDPTSGRVTLDGVDLRRIRRLDLLSHVAAVGQDTFLFNATIAENVRYGAADAPDARLAEAVRIANLAEVVERLPEGLLTPVGERGAKLSGGERQRVAIARAVLKDPRVLLLDEATSDLDAESEQKVQQALDRIQSGRTTLVIAHRLSTVAGADRILVLEQGRIVESGTHAELLERGGLYRRLYDTQFSR